MGLLGYDNVHYETNSQYPFVQLNESRFIEELFAKLAEAFRERFADYEFFVFSNHEQGVVPESSNLVSAKPKVLLYFSDEKGEDPAYFSHQYDAVFKSYLSGPSSSANVFPLPLGYVKDVPELPVKPVNERRYNVFFRGNLNVNRLPFYKSFSLLRYLLPDGMKGERFVKDQLLKVKSDFSSYFPQSIIRFNNSFKSGLTPTQYSEVLSESKVVLCPAGFSSAECFRHYESMRAGCVIVSEKLPDNELYNGSPIIQITNWREGLAIVDRLIKDPVQMQKIHENALLWWKDKWSEAATANYIKTKILSLS